MQEKTLFELANRSQTTMDDLVALILTSDNPQQSDRALEVLKERVTQSGKPSYYTRYCIQLLKGKEHVANWAWQQIDLHAKTAQRIIGILTDPAIPEQYKSLAVQKIVGLESIPESVFRTLIHNPKEHHELLYQRLLKHTNVDTLLQEICLAQWPKEYVQRALDEVPKAKRGSYFALSYTASNEKVPERFRMAAWEKLEAHLVEESRTKECPTHVEYTARILSNPHLSHEFRTRVWNFSRKNCILLNCTNDHIYQIVVPPALLDVIKKLPSEDFLRPLAWTVFKQISPHVYFDEARRVLPSNEIPESWKEEYWQLIIQSPASIAFRACGNILKGYDTQRTTWREMAFSYLRDHTERAQFFLNQSNWESFIVPYRELSRTIFNVLDRVGEHRQNVKRATEGSLQNFSTHDLESFEQSLTVINEYDHLTPEESTLRAQIAEILPAQKHKEEEEKREVEKAHIRNLHNVLETWIYFDIASSRVITIEELQQLTILKHLIETNHPLTLAQQDLKQRVEDAIQLNRQEQETQKKEEKQKRVLFEEYQAKLANRARALVAVFNGFTGLEIDTDVVLEGTLSGEYASIHYTGSSTGTSLKLQPTLAVTQQLRHILQLAPTTWLEMELEQNPAVWGIIYESANFLLLHELAHTFKLEEFLGTEANENDPNRALLLEVAVDGIAVNLGLNMYVHSDDRRFCLADERRTLILRSHRAMAERVAQDYPRLTEEMDFDPNIAKLLLLRVYAETIALQNSWDFGNVPDIDVALYASIIDVFQRYMTCDPNDLSINYEKLDRIFGVGGGVPLYDQSTLRDSSADQEEE